MTTRVPEIIRAAGAILQRYDVIFCDVWGVVHDGHRAYETACAALIRFRGQGGTVVLVSNAPVPEERVAAMLERCRVPPAAWDVIVSSGAIALARIASKGYRRVYYIGPRDRDAAFFSRSTARPAALDEAEAIVCTGLNDDLNETADDYRPLLERAIARGLPFVCANPDLVVSVGGRHFPCAGAIADLYERMGGDVFWAGKPHASAFEAARQEAGRIRGAMPAPDRILVIGDALRTDLKGAQNAGLDAIFIAGGIHRADVVREGELARDKLTELFGPDAPPAHAAMIELAW